ncbi:MAG: tetratricopeptide repeat protein, partial [Cyanobacteria bacterium P01_D01_bin.156]
MTNLRVDELLQKCTVKLSVLETGEVGTGFFIAPGFILTCEHVVRDGRTCSVRYGDTEEFATAEVIGGWADCDVALLAFEPTGDGLPCVMLGDSLQPGDDLFLFGYPTRNFADGCPVTASFEGIAPGPPREIKFKAGRITPGMSGSPLLNLRTGMVCGMVTFTRDETSDLGGGAVPVAEIWQCLPEQVRQANSEFHQRDRRWQRALPKAEETGQVLISQSVDGNQNITVGSISGNPTIIGNQTIENILPTPTPDVTGIPSNLRERGSRTFVGRDQTLKELHSKLQTSQTLAITALQGMGGIGKTEMAVQYALQYKSQYPSGVCWLSARGAEVGTQLVNFAVAVLGLPQPDGELTDQVQFVWNRWPGTEKALLIYDDVADYGEIENLLPTDQRFQVLLTTRVQNLAAGVDDFPLELLSQEASLELLRRIVGTARINAELTIAEALCERVGYLPLGLELLGYFLKNKPRMSLAKLEQRLEKNRLNAKAFKQAHPGMTAKLGVYEAFELSWNELSEAGQELACWLSLFALAPIPWGLAAANVEENDQDDWEDVRDDELLKLSLLQRLEAGTYQLHQLVREFLLAKLEEQEAKDDLKADYGQLMVRLAKGIGQSATLDTIQQLTPVVAHIAEVINHWADSLADEDFFRPFGGLTMFYYAQGIYDVAIGWAAQATIATRARFGEEHPSVATSVNNLAGLYESQGRYEQAEPLYQQALAMRKKLLGEEHPSVATSVNNLAGLYESQGRYEQAEPLYQQALAMLKKLLGEEHPDVAT